MNVLRPTSDELVAPESVAADSAWQHVVGESRSGRVLTRQAPAADCLTPTPFPRALHWGSSRGALALAAWVCTAATLVWLGGQVSVAPVKAGNRRCPPLTAPQGRVLRVADATSLAQAVTGLASDTTVLLTDGTYRISQTLHIGGGVRNVALRGASGDRDRVVIQGPGMRNARYGDVPHGVLVGNAQDVLIADMTIRDVYYHAVQVQGEQGARGLRLYNVRLVDAGEQFVKGSTAGPPGPYPDDGEVACSLIEYTDRARHNYTNGVDVLGGANWVVRDNVFRRMRAPSGQLAGPAVLFWRNATNTVVERNLFIECDRSIALGLAAPDPRLARDGEATFDHQGGVIRNNMIYQPPGADTTDIGITVNYARDFSIQHNTVVLNGTFPWGAIEYRFGPSRGNIMHNLTDAPIWRRDGAEATVRDNVTSARLGWFVDPSAGDLHLRSSASGAIDQVAPLASVRDDFDGQPRPLGPRADIGADEYGEVPRATTAVAATAVTATPSSTGTTAVPDTPSPTATLTVPVTPSPTAIPTVPATPTASATPGAPPTASASATNAVRPTPLATASPSEPPKPATATPAIRVFMPRADKTPR